ncbi:hypothetical protein [Erwinia amylovora]|uniref:hypothetical protein n=1 Tax=Erwinia amylovora TaxID=552 RepID=UPI001F0377A8|nr:hypothetical protein [Erwinia amylovora]
MEQPQRLADVIAGTYLKGLIRGSDSDRVGHNGISGKVSSPLLASGLIGIEVKISAKPFVSREVAVHEAGHAIAAWYNRCSDIEIAIANEDRIAQTRSGEVLDCVAVTRHSKIDDNGTLEAKVRIGMTFFAGVAAQGRYSGDKVEDLLLTAGKYDHEQIKKLIKEYCEAGATELEGKEAYDTARRLAIKLIERHWWEVIAVAKMIENRSYISVTDFESMMRLLTPGRITIPTDLKELENTP